MKLYMLFRKWTLEAGWKGGGTQTVLVNRVEHPWTRNKKLRSGLLASLLLGAPGHTTRSKKLLKTCLVNRVESSVLAPSSFLLLVVWPGAPIVASCSLDNSHSRDCCFRRRGTVHLAPQLRGFSSRWKCLGEARPGQAAEPKHITVPTGQLVGWRPSRWSMRATSGQTSSRYCSCLRSLCPACSCVHLSPINAFQQA